jgi:hypothetical protein
VNQPTPPRSPTESHLLSILPHQQQLTTSSTTMAQYEYSKIDAEFDEEAQDEKIEIIEISAEALVQKRRNVHRQHRLFVACAILILVPVMAWVIMPAGSWPKIPLPSAASIKKMFCHGRRVQSELSVGLKCKAEANGGTDNGPQGA